MDALHVGPAVDAEDGPTVKCLCRYWPLAVVRLAQIDAAFRDEADIAITP